MRIRSGDVAGQLLFGEMFFFAHCETRRRQEKGAPQPQSHQGFPRSGSPSRQRGNGAEHITVRENRLWGMGNGEPPGKCGGTTLER